MLHSGYQIEAFLNAFRKRQGYQQVALHSIDHLDLSEEGRRDAQIRVPVSKPHLNSEWITPQNILESIADQTPLDPAIEYEQQRRAGMFLDPPYLPPKNTPEIQRVYDYLGAFRQAYEQAQQVPSEKETGAGVSPASAGQPDLRKSGASLTQQQTSRPSPVKAQVPPQQATPEVSTLLENKEDDFEVDEDSQRTGELIESDVVYGTAHITDESIMEFIYNYPDSALKFLFRKQMDGTPLSKPVQTIYEEWQKRGLSRNKLRQGILQLMEWSQLPKASIEELYSMLRDKLYDLKHNQ
ncbi:hypothetical protein WDW89_07700 [Deltaproteobacteria bacterium TL4]